MRLSQTSQFKRDIRRQIKRGKDSAKIRQAVEILMSGKSLPGTYRDHPLRGQWRGRRDCHLEPDWILIYRISDDELRLERTGSHIDIFG